MWRSATHCSQAVRTSPCSVCGSSCGQRLWAALPPLSALGGSSASPVSCGTPASPPSSLAPLRGAPSGVGSRHSAPGTRVSQPHAPGVAVRARVRRGRTILYFTILYFTVLWRTVLYCTALYFTMLYCAVLCCAVHYSTRPGQGGIADLQRMGRARCSIRGRDGAGAYAVAQYRTA